MVERNVQKIFGYNISLNFYSYLMKCMTFLFCRLKPRKGKCKETSIQTQVLITAPGFLPYMVKRSERCQERRDSRFRVRPASVLFWFLASYVTSV